MKKLNYKKDKIKVIKNSLDKDLIDFLYNYLLMKEEVLLRLLNEKYISPFETGFGIIGDPQVPDSGLCLYGDPVGDTILLRLQQVIEKQTKLKLIPTYSYSRNYRRNNELNRHTDRPSCAVSATLNVGGDPWPIFIEPSGKKDKKGKEIILKPGDLLMYQGCTLEHWREPFKGEKCVQLFLHYTQDKNTNLLYDTRPYLGLPSFFKNEQDN
jgi:hypothetical protein|tara:strand:+ start:3001 stop:3633 length:633 start_codon:yes stop_codon:yes gene_type:complete